MKKIFILLSIACLFSSCSKKLEKTGNIIVNITVEDISDIITMDKYSAQTRAFLYKCDEKKLYGKKLCGNIFEWASGMPRYVINDEVKYPDYQNDVIDGIVTFSDIPYGCYLLVISTDTYGYPVIERMKINVNSGLIQERKNISPPMDFFDKQLREAYKDIIISEYL